MHLLTFVADSWPQVLEDSNARKDWSWRHEYDLNAMTAAMLEALAPTGKVTARVQWIPWNNMTCSWELTTLHWVLRIFIGQLFRSYFFLPKDGCSTHTLMGQYNYMYFRVNATFPATVWVQVKIVYYKHQYFCVKYTLSLLAVYLIYSSVHKFHFNLTIVPCHIVPNQAFKISESSSNCKFLFSWGM